MRARAWVCVWEYEVAPGRAREFERAYGPAGDWVRLFSRAPGHLRTELLRDAERPARYLTIDVWESRAAWERFRARWTAEYAALDARCGALTTRETQLGGFDDLEQAEG